LSGLDTLDARINFFHSRTRKNRTTQAIFLRALEARTAVEARIMQAAEEIQHNGDSHAASAAENAQKIDAAELEQRVSAQAESNGKEAAERGEERANGGAEGAQQTAWGEDDSTAKRKRSDSQPQVEDNDAKRAYTEFEEASKQPPSVDYTAHLTQLYQDAGEISAIPREFPA
jgi:hypothetical protein